MNLKKGQDKWRGAVLYSTAMVAVLIVYRYYIPVPSDFSQPWKVSALMSSFKVGQDMGKMISAFSGRPAMVEKGHLLNIPAQFLIPFMFKKDPYMKITDENFDGVPVRVYAPRNQTLHGPAVVYIHGGGWTVGSVALYDKVVYSMAQELQMVFVSIEYRLAPEHIFPAGLLDCEVALSYFLHHARDYSVDPDRVAVMGDSAGGNLAAAIALKFRAKMLQPKLQILIDPVLQGLDLNTPSYQENGDRALVISKENIADCLLLYATGNLDLKHHLLDSTHTSPEIKYSKQSIFDHSSLPDHFFPPDYVPVDLNTGNHTIWEQLKTVMLNPYFAPLLTKDLSGLPSAFIHTAQYDVLRDEGVWYAKRLREAGVQVTHFHQRTAYHVVFAMFDIIPEGQICFDAIIDYIRHNL